MHILFTSGGSIGHIAPLIAIWEAVKHLAPDATAEVCCSSDAEAAYCKEHGLQATVLPQPRRNLTLPWTFLSAYFKARSLLSTKKVDIVLGKGGAISVPVCLAAHQKGIPLVLHESDTVMGRANQLLARYAETVCCGFTTDHPRGTITGNPVQERVLTGSRKKGLAITGFSGDKPVLLVMGGSQGAQSINDAITQQLTTLTQHCDVVHLTGKGKLTHDACSGYFPMEFATTELPHFYAMATIALGRSGNGFLNEMAANCIPSVVVPLEGLAQNHQYKNAQFAEKHGGCTLLRQVDLTEKLVPTVTHLLSDTAVLDQKKDSIAPLYNPDAARDIAQILLDTVASTALSS